MKKKQFKHVFFLLMSVFFLASCSDTEMDSTPVEGGSQSATSTPDYVFAIKQPKAQVGTKAVGVTGSYWDNGQTIRIKFLNGTAKIQEKVKLIGSEWLQYANLKFEYVTSGDADVKIAFGFNNDHISWSYIGKNSKTISQTMPSMNITPHSDGIIDNNPDFAALVLREYGHMLGLGFEHQGQAAMGKINFDEDKLINYFYSQGWDDNYLFATLFDQYNKYTAEHIRFDSQSIMLLYFPAFVTTDGKGTTFNNKLSADDKKFMLARYPFKKGIELVVAGTPHQYEAVRIGEYWWMNRNFNSPSGPGLSPETLALAMQRVGVNPANYPVTVSDFLHYFGEYYIRQTPGYEWLYYNTVGYNINNGVKKAANWRAPGMGDFNQLFAMCGTGSTNDVRNYLGCKAGDNPAAIAAPGVRWFEGNENVYGFNMMPGAARINGAEGIYVGGDIYDLFKFARFPVDGGVTVTIPGPDYNHTRYTGKLWHWLTVRFCEQLTADELGYKLYINSGNTDIKKMKLTETPPYGYTELGNGYLRGFYVQYIMDKSYPEKTIAQIVQMANSL